METKDYGEIFCQAVDEIVSQRIDGIKFDSTILCAIVDDSWRDTGKYIVTHNGGVTKFEAFSDNTNYRNNNNVYVQIPGGDWDQQKIIIAKKTDKTEEPYIYKKPFSSLVDITGNLIRSDIEPKVTGLVANQNYGEIPDNQECVINLWSYNLNDSDAIYREEGAPYAAYTRLGIQAGFQSWLNTFYTTTGDKEIDSVNRAVTCGKYGLRLIVTPKREQVVSITEQSKKQANYILELSSDDMNGNPYNFDSFYTQQKLFDISSVGEIEKLQLQFYEVTGSFKDNEGYLIPDKDFLDNIIMPNLYVNDIYITLGYDANEFDTEMVQLYTLDESTYSRTADPLTNNHKKLQIRWIHKMEDGSYKSITPSDNIGVYEVYWYRHQLGAPSADEYSGVYWKMLSSQSVDADNNFSYEIYDDDWKTYNLTCDIGYNRQPSYFTSWSIPDVTLQQEEYKVIIIYNKTPYRSNVLTFQNKDEVVSGPTVDAVQALSINCEDNTYGNYRIYNQGNSLLDASQSAIKRQWKLYFKSSTSKNDNSITTPLVEAEQIEWIIPLTKTMIVMDMSKSTDFYTYDYDEDNKPIRVHIFRYGEKANKYQLKDNTLTYRIKGYYSQSYSDNTIQCKVIKDKITYTTTKEMTFGVAGTTGTDCTFILDFDNGVTAVSPEDRNNQVSVSVTARLYDYENREVDLSSYAEKIIWSWKTSDGLIEIGGGSTGISKNLVYRGSSSLEYSYNILQAKLTGWGNYDLVAYLPIPIRKDITRNYISGTTQVIYNSDGGLIDYFKNPYILYTNTEPTEGIVWSIKNKNSGEENSNTTTKDEYNKYTPVIKNPKNSNEYYLSPLSFYVEESCKEVCVIAKNGNTILWSQPLLIMMNKYPSAMINEWDGELNVGALDKGTILAPRLVAGMKDNNNKFSGVMLGNWSESVSDASLTNSLTGLYGYDKGEQSYAFKQDGTAFIGKSGKGRIEFNGTEGIIESSGYKTGHGMSINLQNNLIEGKYKNNTVFKLDGGNGADLNTYFEIKNENNKTLMSVGNSSYYLQSDNYNSSNNTGTYLNLNDGELITNNGTFNGQIYIYYSGTNDKYWWSDNNTTRKTTLNAVLDEINNNINRLDSTVASIKEIQAWQNTQISRINQGVAAFSDLSYYFGLGYGDQGQRTITMQSYMGGEIQLGYSVNFYGHDVQVHTNLNIESGYTLKLGGETLYDYIIKICDSR